MNALKSAIEKMDERIWKCNVYIKFINKEELNEEEKNFIKYQIKEWLK